MLRKLESGTDRKSRSGVIWHTQGSGKSLTMVFLVRKMRHIKELHDYRILMVVDRHDLEEQLAETRRTVRKAARWAITSSKPSPMRRESGSPAHH